MIPTGQALDRKRRRIIFSQDSEKEHLLSPRLLPEVNICDRTCSIELAVSDFTKMQIQYVLVEGPDVRASIAHLSMCVSHGGPNPSL
jgi:hypothetical protein